jgi:glycosyltransferase involved in cell wall biosynthesis
MKKQILRETSRILHVAALPFPSYQGTQGALRSMLETSVAAGRDAQLFTYRTKGYDFQPNFPLHRTGTFPRVSLRSGPSLPKMLLDTRMGFELRKLQMRLAPNVVIAHHVEAAALAIATARQPVVFFAHTDLHAELPCYGPRVLSSLLERAGHLLDVALARRADAVAVISKTLETHFAQRLGDQAHKLRYVPTPWRVQAPISTDERARSRAALDLPDDAVVALYAGNLDAYQGLESLLQAVRLVAEKHPRFSLLVATESNTDDLLHEARRLGIHGRVTLTGLAGEDARRRVHAAADLAVVPRLSPGGLPIKLLDALARGVPCATTRRACAGLPLERSTQLAQDEGPGGLAEAIDVLVSSPRRRIELSSLGKSYIAAEHAPERFLQAMDSSIAEARKANFARA